MTGDDLRAHASFDEEAALARRLLGMLDLTSLGADDTESGVRALLARAHTEAGTVAAVCLWPRFARIAREALEGTGVAVATVVNFPAGEDEPGAVMADIDAAVRGGANEIDVVFPYRVLLAGDEAAGTALVRACRAQCGSRALLKVILETGQLASPERIRHAAQIAVDGGAQFLKTSTGKTQPGATLAAADAMLDVIVTARERGVPVGLKVSGGVARVTDAASYLALFERRIGEARKDNFRIGASSLINELLATIDRSASVRSD